MRAGIRVRPWAGLDVGSFSIKLIASQAGVTGPHFRVAERPAPGADAERDQPATPESVAHAIADCLSQAGLSPRSIRGVSLGIAGPDVIVKQIALPLLDDAEVGPALRFEARKHLPFDPSGMVIDFQILGRFPSERRLEVLLAAVTQEHVERSLAPLRLLGLDADIIDPAPLALSNAVAQAGGADGESCVLLDIGQASSHLTLQQRGQPYFSRRLEFGGQTLSRAIAEAMRVPVAEAEELKLAVGDPESGLRMDWNAPEMQALLSSLQRDLVDELRRSFAFYRTIGRLPEPLALWLSGGTARMSGFAEHLGGLLDIPVRVFDPLENRAADGGAPARPPGGPQFAQAFGLALRGA